MVVDTHVTACSRNKRGERKKEEERARLFFLSSLSVGGGK